jgi:hypothetical protein
MKRQLRIVFLSTVVLIVGPSFLYADHHENDYGTNCPAQYPSSCGGTEICEDEAPEPGNGQGSCVPSHYCCATGFGAHCKYISGAT